MTHSIKSPKNSLTKHPAGSKGTSKANRERTLRELFIHGFIEGYEQATGKVPAHYAISARFRIDNEETKKIIRRLKTMGFLKVKRGFPGYDIRDRRVKLVPLIVDWSEALQDKYWTVV